jgi:RNA polymerase sigma factor (sigma-70 family)
MNEVERAVRRAAAGDVAAFNWLVRTHQAKLRGFLLRLTGGRHALADDLAQESFILAWRKIGEFRGDGSFMGWLFSIAYSRFLMEMRRRNLESIGEESELASDPRSAQLTKLDLETAMARLLPGQRAALTLCYALGFTHEEAAVILQLPLGRLKSHLVRGRERLRSLLEGEHDSA